MDLPTFSSRLTSEGLATYLFAPDCDWIEVGLPHQPEEPPRDARTVVNIAGRDVYLTRWELPDRRVWVADPAGVYKFENRWSFANEGCVQFGGMDLEIVQCYRDSLDEMYELVWNYYFHEPVLIGGWRVPLYQHPNWKLQEIEKAIANGAIKTPAEAIAIFAAAREGWRFRPNREIGPSPGPEFRILPTMDDLLHYTIRDPRSPERKLHLRYDCKEAFIEEPS